MNANYKNRVDVKTQKRIELAVIEEFDRIKHKYERKFSDKYSLIFMLGLLVYADEDLGYGEKRRTNMLNGIVKRINEISSYLTENKVIDASTHKEEYDTDYNREHLKKLANQYHLSFDESILDDDIDYDSPDDDTGTLLHLNTISKEYAEQVVENFESFIHLPGNENVLRAYEGKG